jgi:hypothetical protein
MTFSNLGFYGPIVPYDPCEDECCREGKKEEEDKEDFGDLELSDLFVSVWQENNGNFFNSQNVLSSLHELGKVTLIKLY